MRKTIITLTVMVILLGSIASGVGLFWNDGGSSFTFETQRGERVEIYGRGLYKYDTFFKAPINRGTDLIFLFLGVPMLGLALRQFCKNTLKGKLLLLGVLTSFLYYGISLCTNVAYNQLIIVYIGLFSSSLFAWVNTLRSVNLSELEQSVSDKMPRKAISVFLTLAGMSVMVWLMDLLGTLLQGQVIQGLDSYTTEMTYVLDLGIIAPLAFSTAIGIRKKNKVAYAMTPVLLILNAFIGFIVIGQTVMQYMDGLRLTFGELVAFVGIFVVMSFIALFLTTHYFKHIQEKKA